MATSSVESLIQKSTNPLNSDEDPNSIQAVCQAVSTEPGGVQTAVRLIAHKIQSPQERESLQALAVLQACVNNCGPAFHAEIGKFRFLNEMIKLVSPKYLGNQTHISVKSRVVELLYAWTLDLKTEPKVLEAYHMLKRQGVVKDDPVYIGAPAPEPRARANAVFEDEEKSKLLHRLLQSKNPEDLHKANALIKSMVKEDERRMERTSRRVVEVETAVNNVRVLDEMLSRHQESPAAQPDLDLMHELHSSCSTLRSNIYRLVSEMDDKEDGIGDLLKANDELSRVMGRYKLVVDGTRDAGGAVQDAASAGADASKGGEVLLDLSLPGDEAAKQGTTEMLNQDLQDLGLGELSLASAVPSAAGVVPEVPKVSGAEPATASIIDDLSGIFSAPVNDGLGSGALQAALAPALVPQPLGVVNSNETINNESGEKTGPLDDLDLLGTNLMKENLPANMPLQKQFKLNEKMSMNQLKQQQHQTNISSLATLTSTPLVAAPVSASLSSGSAGPSSTQDGDILEPLVPLGVAAAGPDENKPLAGLDFLSGDLNIDLKPKEDNSKPSDKPSLLDDSSLLCDNEDGLISSTQVVKPEPGVDKPPNDVLSNLGSKPRNTTAKPQFMEVKPMSDLKVGLEEIKPGKQGSVSVIESNDITVTIHFTENQPRDDVSVVVVSTMSRCSQPISNYVLQAVVPKGCKVRLQTPSSTELAAFSPFLPPPAITQIMFIANPNKLNVSLKAMLSYCVDDDPVTEMGEVESLPL